MNPIRKHLQVQRTGVKKREYETFSINEGIQGTSMVGASYEEYRFDAVFGARHLLNDVACHKDKVLLLDLIKENVLRKVCNELYGDIREDLYELRIKLYEKNLITLANDVSKIIDKTL